MGYDTIHLDDVEPNERSGGAVRFVRRELGCEAFGFNHFTLPPNGVGREHDERDSGQEEVSFVIAGGGHWTVDGEDVPVRAGSFVRFDAESTRCPVAGPDGMSFLSIGSRRGVYEPRGPF